MTDKTKTKVLFLITKSNWGGAQRYVYDLATSLPTDQYEVIVALGGDGPLASKLVADGYIVATIPGLQRDISLKQELLASWNIAHIIREHNPDILHINSSKAGAVGAFLGRILGVPRVIFTAHGWAFNEDRGLLSRTIIKTIHWLTVLFAHHTIAVSHIIKSQLNWPLVQHKMTVVHNGRVLPSFYSKTVARETLIKQHAALTPYSSDPWVITVGELHHTKGYDVAINAVAQAVKTHPELRYLIIGTGELHSQLQTQIAALQLSHTVFLLGSIDEAAEYLTAADIFLLASRSEALSYVVTEAAMAALPIIASNVGGIPEIVEDGVSATLVASGDSEAIARALSYYLTQPDTARGHAAAALVASRNFSMEQMVANTEAVYQT